MSTITATLKPNADGTLHLPLPPELQHRMVKITATVEPASEGNDDPPATQASLKGFGSLKGKLWMADDFDAPLEDFKEYME